MKDYDVNGNMKTFPDKGISQINYNFLNLPQSIIQNSNFTNYLYRADGIKVNKAFILNGTTIDTDYLDGFVYTSTYTQQLEAALLADDLPTREAVSAGQEESMQLERKVVAVPNNPPSVAAAKPSFFPTAEGFYDYDNYKYIYQYKDHLGNVRLSYSKNATTGLIAIEDTNDYYPFGLSFINGGASRYSPSTTYKNWKFGNKELQETGFVDFGARMYMPDIGRWGVPDPFAEKAPDWTSYRYAFNNPIRYLDPNGLYETDGHFWTVYLMATMMGRKDAYSLAYYTEAPDNIMARNGEVLSSPSTWRNPVYQRSLHALTGGTSTFARDNARNMLSSADSYEEIGNALHYFGDSYAHTKTGDDRLMYPTGRGHLFEGHSPDKIAERPELYLEYANNLAGALGSKLGGGKIDMFTFNYVAKSGGSTEQNSAVFETEVRIREGAQTFSVAGNQVGAINNYLKARNGHFSGHPNANVINTNVDVYKQNKNGEWEKSTQNRTLVTFAQ